MRRHAESQRPTVNRVVKTGIARGGKPIPAPQREVMEQRFGRNFGDVRLHTDEAAGESALALGASAYTVGRDIAFAPGALERDGEKLLAHELAHAATADANAEPERIDAPGSSEERQAEQAADAVAAGRPVGRLSAGGGGAMVHRSLLGASLGGLVGGVGLGVLGGMLLGPVGAVLGAVVGTVAGAVIGDHASRRERGLKAEEKTYAWDIYRDSIDYDAISISRGSALATGAARTIGNTINLQPEHFKGDTMELSDAGQLVLIHEMGHVWQYQNGGLDYIPSSLIPQIELAAQGRSRNEAYDWRKAVQEQISWSDWNAEQQAECISDYNEALRRIKAQNGTATPRDYQTVALAEPYIGYVRQRFGAPGMREGRVVTGTAP